MYSIYARKGEERICVYNDSYQLEETTLIDPKLELSESLAGTFKAKLPAKNNGYEFIERLNTEIIIYKNKKEIWSGRVIKEDTDFWKNRSIECEGELAYLNDTIQPQAEYTDISASRLLDTLIRVHNTKAPDDKKFTIGAVTVQDTSESLAKYTNYESTLEAIGNLLIKRLGGFLRIRKVDGIRYIDYIREQDRETSTQIIQFGRNLLDFTKTYDATEFCTVLLPLGGRLTEEDGSSASDIEGLEAYVTVEEVNEGSPYVVNADTIEEFGWIEKKVTWNDIEEPSELMTKAVEYLEEVQFDDMELEVNAVDLGYLESDFDNINLSEKVKVISSVHGLNKFFPVKKISIPINDPAHTTFTMGTAVKTNFTVRTNSGTGYVEDLIDDIPSESEILNYAKRNATSLIKSCTSGYITITTRDNGTQEFIISDVPLINYDPNDPTAEASSYWQWNLNGLAHFNRADATPDNPEGMKLALTKDGEIVADRITTGVLTAEVIKTGILRGYDNQDNWWNLKTGELHIGTTAKYGTGNQTIETRFSVTDGLISSEVERATEAEGILGSSIVQTATAISSSVYVDGKFYDPGSYTISVSGVGNPNGQVNASSYTYRYYMDVTNGYIYRSNGSTWNYVTTATSKSNSIVSNILQTAEAISSEVSRATDAESNISSKILQTATAISSSVSASGKWYDPGSYTISVSGVGSPDGQYSPGSYYYQYYMDITNGYIYHSNGYSWSYVARATQQTGSMASTIKQTASEVSLKISKGDEFRTELSANADSIRMVSSKILIKADNLTVTEDGTLTCNNAVIHGTVEVGGKDNNYGSLIIKDYSDNNSMTMDYHGIHDSDWNFSLTKDGISFSNGDYWNPRGAGMNSDGTVSLYELDIRDGNGVYVFKENDYRQGLTGTIQVYTYVGHGNTRRQRYFHFKNGILYSIDETYDDGFTSLID